MITDAQEIVATLKNIEVLLQLGSIRISDIAAANEIARIEANLLSWEIVNGDTKEDAAERGVKFVQWVRECVG